MFLQNSRLPMVASWPGMAMGDRNLLGRYSTYKVGLCTQFRDYEKVHQGRLYFAGEHTSYNLQGFREHGTHSGPRAAGAVLAALALKPYCPKGGICHHTAS
jgi:hypothetical protein